MELGLLRCTTGESLNGEEIEEPYHCFLPFFTHLTCYRPPEK